MGLATVKALTLARAAASDFKITMHGVHFKTRRTTCPECPTRRAHDLPFAQRGWTPGRCRDWLAAAARA
jgi:dissimilatory sulfite reductase (desulfoviridin) alpha/beta subunit